MVRPAPCQHVLCGLGFRSEAKGSAGAHTKAQACLWIIFFFFYFENFIQFEDNIFSQETSFWRGGWMAPTPHTLVSSADFHAG